MLLMRRRHNLHGFCRPDLVPATILLVVKLGVGATVCAACVHGSRSCVILHHGHFLEDAVRVEV